MSQYNDLSVEVYTSSTTLIKDPRQEIRLAEGINYQTQYPGGLYGAASFFVPHPVTNWWELAGGQRVVIRNKQRQVYEGYISNLQSVINPAGQGIQVNCIGGWGHILMNWRFNKRWADTRIDEATWVEQITTGDAEEHFEISRTNNKVHFTPKSGTFSSGDYAAVRYAMPVGETVKRITYDYDFEEATGSWEISVWRSTDASSWTQMTAGSGETYATGTTTVITSTATGSIDVTLATPSRYMELRYYARGTNNPVVNDHNHGEFTLVTVYSETGSINQEEIAKDLIGLVTDLNTSTIFISTAGSPLTLVPFLTNGYQNAADILNEAASRGDAAFNRWAAYLVGSERANSPNGKPMLVLSSYATTTSSEYVLSLNDPNLEGGLSISQDFDSIVNHIIIGYTDQANRVQYLTPDDVAALEDTTSISDYGMHAIELNIGPSTAAIAESVGKRYLASYKDPQYHLSGPITVQGYIRSNRGNPIPASEIRSRHRVRIDDYLNDVTGSGQGLTFVITQTQYSHIGETCSITTGVPQAPMIPGYVHPVVSEPVDQGGGGGGNTVGGGGEPGFNWWERYNKATGGGRQGWLDMSQAERNKWKKTGWRAWKKKKG